MKTTIIIIIIFSVALQSFAIEYPGGARIVKVNSSNNEDSMIAGQCTFQLLLASAVLHKESGWFFKDKEVIVKIDVKINGIDQVKTSPETATFTRLYSFEISEFGNGQISLPFSNLTLLDWYPTRINNETIITGVEVNVEVAKKVKETVFNHVITSTIKLTDNLNIPTNPYTATAKQMGLFTRDLLNDDFFKNSGSDKSNFASIGIRFSPLIIKEKSDIWIGADGIYAIVMGRKDDKSEGHIDVLNIGDAIFRYNQNGGLRVKRNNQEVTVANDYLVFIINSWESPQQVVSKNQINLQNGFIRQVNSNSSLRNWHIDTKAINRSMNDDLNPTTEIGARTLIETGNAINKEKIINRFMEAGIELSTINPPTIDAQLLP